MNNDNSNTGGGTNLWSNRPKIICDRKNKNKKKFHFKFCTRIVFLFTMGDFESFTKGACIKPMKILGKKTIVITLIIAEGKTS